MKLLLILRRVLGTTTREHPRSSSSARAPTNTHLLDIYFTKQFHAKAAEWGLSEDHARFVYYEGDSLKEKGEENMRIALYKGEEIGIYVFHDRETNQPVVTSIWKRPARRGSTATAKNRC